MDEGGKSYVPYDIISNILIWLPVKSLLRFKAVSKTCLAIISDSVFVIAHLHQSKNPTRQHLLIEEYPDNHEEAKSIKIEDRNRQVESVVRYPLKKYGPFLFLCCCDGLSIFWCICLWGGRGPIKRLFMLRNPSSRTFRLFWCPYDLPGKGLLCYGLCYDPLIEDYKFIVTDMNQYHAVFYCGNSSWIERKELLLDGAFRANRNIQSTAGVCFDGDLYWLLSDHEQRLYEIVRFDLRYDNYRMIRKPEDLRWNPNSAWYLASLGGHLCLCHNMKDDSMMQIFTLRKDGDRDTWMEFITIDLSSAPTPTDYAKPVFLTNENEIILQVGESHLLVYSLSEKTFAEIQKKWNDLHYPPIPYVDNLFFSSGRNNEDESVAWGIASQKDNYGISL